MLVGAGLVILVVALGVSAVGKRGQQQSGSEIPTGTETLLPKKTVEMSSNNTTMGSSTSVTGTDHVPSTAQRMRPTTMTAGSTNVETAVDPNGLTTSAYSEPLSSDDPNPSTVVAVIVQSPATYHTPLEPIHAKHRACNTPAQIM